MSDRLMNLIEAVSMQILQSHLFLFLQPVTHVYNFSFWFNLLIFIPNRILLY